MWVFRLRRAVSMGKRFTRLNLVSLPVWIASEITRKRLPFVRVTRQTLDRFLLVILEYQESVFVVLWPGELRAQLRPQNAMAATTLQEDIDLSGTLPRVLCYYEQLWPIKVNLLLALRYLDFDASSP